MGHPAFKTHDDALAAFMANVDRSSGCWLWTGSRSSSGYADFPKGNRFVGTRMGHRFHWLTVRGGVDEGLHLDHICRVRHCVNLDHLRVVTPQVNILAGVGAAATNARKTVAKCGHPFTPNYGQKRTCRTCYLQRQRHWKAKAQLLRTLDALADDSELAPWLAASFSDVDAAKEAIKPKGRVRWT